MKELDLLKKNWKNSENSFEQISEKDLYKMLHHKSSSIVKLILILSIAEVLFWTFISVFFNGDEYLKKLHHDEIFVYLKVITYFNYAVILVFIYLFYKNYKMISTMTSTKQLMKDILKTRKTVHCYVYYNLIMIVLSLVAGFYMAFAFNPEVSVLKDKIASDPKAMAIVVGLLTLVTLVFFGVFWLFYRLLYGTLLRKLYANYNELKKIDL
mgnify:FL=1